jgi:hypothetical protein
LSDQGIIEEIPHVIYAVTSGIPKRFRTEIGTYHFHHLPEHLIWGYEIKQAGRMSFCIAEPEKAFLDLIYLSLIPRSSIQMVQKRGKEWKLDLPKLNRYAKRFSFLPLISYLEKIFPS